MNPLSAKAYGLLLGAALAAAGLPVGPGGLTSRAVVSSGHQGAVRDMQVDNGRGMIFSAGEDGTLRVWDTATQTLVRRIAITRQRILSLSMDPAAPLAAVLLTDGTRAFWADVWNWDTGELLYRVPLEASPLFIHFSLTGTYLLLGTMSWDSLRVYRASDGQPVDAPDEGGMVSFAEVSRSDGTLMTYRLSGAIEYRDLASGTVVKQVPAVPDLVDIRASADRRYIVGHSDTDVVCVDALTGETRVDVPAAGVASLDISDRADRIAWIDADGLLQGWSASGTTPSSSAGALGWRPGLLRFSGSDLLLGGPAGQMVRVSPTGQQTSLAQDILARATGLAASDTMFAVAAGPLIRVFHLPPRLAEQFSIPSPFGDRPVGLQAIDDTRLLAWPQGDGAGALVVIDYGTGTWTRVNAAFPNPLISVACRNGRAYTLEQGGRIQVVDLATGQEVFETTRPGSVCLAALEDNVIVVGKGQTGTLDASMVMIHLDTGETVPVTGTETFTYALAPDPADGSLYSLGVDADGQTRLFHHGGVDLAEESVVDSGDADLSASLSIDPSSGILYSSLGRQRVTAWSGGALRTIGAPSPGIEVLRARNGLVAALRKDSTVSLWDALKDRPVATVYPFSDGSWVAIMADGTVQGAPSGIAKVSLFAQGTLQDRSPPPPPSQEKPVVP